MEIQKFENNILKCSVDCVIVDNNVWFRGKDVAKALGYKDTAQAVRDNVEESFRCEHPAGCSDNGKCRYRGIICD